MARVNARTEWAVGLVSLVLDAKLERYEPGQFFNLALSLKGERVKRAYSIASAKSSAPEFYLVAVSGGRLSPELVRLQVGDCLDIDTRPHGFFVLGGVPRAQELWLVATGTGLGPYLAMLRDGEVFSRYESVLLVHSVREASHLGYRSELEALALERPAFHYLPTLTREPIEGLLQGRFDAILASGELEEYARVPIGPERSHVLLCGNPGMLQTAQTQLEIRGLRKHRRREPGHVTSETYW